MKKVCVYARCSTNESKQNVENQIKTCQKFCESNQWEYEIFYEYQSAYKKSDRKVFKKIIEKIRLREFNVLMVYMLDRFSRETPTKIVSDLHVIVENYRCRFISVKEGIDSENHMWQIIMMVFAYMANSYSQMLGIKVKEGIQRKKEKGKYTGGRPRKKINMDRLKSIVEQNPQGLRKIAELYNVGVPRKDRVSYLTVKRVLQKL